MKRVKLRKFIVSVLLVSVMPITAEQQTVHVTSSRIVKPPFSLQGLLEFVLGAICEVGAIACLVYGMIVGIGASVELLAQGMAGEGHYLLAMAVSGFVALFVGFPILSYTAASLLGYYSRFFWMLSTPKQPHTP